MMRVTHSLAILGIATEVAGNWVEPSFPPQPSSVFHIQNVNTTVNDHTAQLSAHADAISNNADGVSANAADISSVSSVASSNAAAISSNAASISSNAAAISSHEATISSNTAGISSNAAGISSNEAAISSNAAGISSNAAAISSNEGAIASNTASISDHADSISSLTDAVATATGEGVPGTKNNPAPSCRYILQMGGEAHNGHYWIDHGGAETPYQAFCDMKRGGLELVYKIEHGISGDPYSLWTGGGTNADTTTHNAVYQTGDHFVSDKLESFWDSAGTNLNAVHAGVFNGNRRVAFFSFTAANTDYESWFAADYLVDSSYSDVLTETKNYFSIAGDTTWKREWFINGNYGGCSVDAGWLVLDSNEADTCSWEENYGSVDILYNPTQTIQAIDTYAHADTFGVFVDYDVVYDSCQDALRKTDYRARDGNYWIDHADTTSNQLVYCDMEHGGYELVFKVVHGGRVSPRWDSDSADTQNPDASALWSGSTYDFPIVVGRNVDIHDESNSYGNGEHYASPFRYGAFATSDITVDDIEVRVITNEKTLKFAQFSGFAQDDEDAWFAAAYLGANSWSDLTPSSTFNYFSIAGHSEINRNWFINSYYGGCNVDSGWLCVVGRETGCDWEERESGTPDVMYACSASEYDVCSAGVDSGDGCTTITAADNYCFADLLAVFYKWST